MYKKYAELKASIKTLTDELKEIEPQILKEAESWTEPLKIEEIGSFTTVERKSYKYSEALKDKKVGYDTEIKDLQAREVKTGIAETTTSKGIRFTPLKIKE